MLNGSAFDVELHIKGWYRERRARTNWRTECHGNADLKLDVDQSQ
jgi:hypothetical protein